ncbi:hypothetical protein AB0N14_32885 [Streptomyces sp. NPDC051104]|uniref:hypothetical protein n=1 Tax=Streptomyces sp. NPDC051104 TaxID=3155044 RepID=UPI003440B153
MGFAWMHEALDTTASGGRLVLHVFCGPRRFIRELFVQGTTEDLEAARAHGARLGPPDGQDGRGGRGRRTGP